jgi:acyl carrier protein
MRMACNGPGLADKPQYGIKEKNIHLFERKAYMDIIDTLRELITDIMDVEGETITEETYLVRDLGAESIDLLELSVSINHAFQITVKDDELYLRNFRLYIVEAERLGKEPVSYLAERFPFLATGRIAEILADLEVGPAIKIKDLVSYIVYRQED